MNTELNYQALAALFEKRNPATDQEVMKCIAEWRFGHRNQFHCPLCGQQAFYLVMIARTKEKYVRCSKCRGKSSYVNDTIIKNLTLFTPHPLVLFKQVLVMVAAKPAGFYTVSDIRNTFHCSIAAAATLLGRCTLGLYPTYQSTDPHRPIYQVMPRFIVNDITKSTLKPYRVVITLNNRRVGKRATYNGGGYPTMAAAIIARDALIADLRKKGVVILDEA